MTAHAVKGDMMSARTLMVIHEGIEQLAAARSATHDGVTVTSAHAMLFERLHRAFNNPNLLKEVGSVYLMEFRMPAVAQKHLELARQFAPKDRDIEQLQVAAALAVARQMTDLSAFSGLDEAEPEKHEAGAILRKTCKLAHVVDTRNHLGETAGDLDAKQLEFRKTGTLSRAPEQAAPDFNPLLVRAQELLDQSNFGEAVATLAEAQKAGAPKEELQAFYARLGLAAFDHGQLDDALSAFIVMRDLGPAAIEGWFNCGLVYHKMGRFDDALASYQMATVNAPDNAKTWCNLSAVWFDKGNYAEAERSARRSIELKDDYARAWDNLASALSAMDRLAEASDACQKAIHIQPALHSAWFKFGVVNFQMENLFVATEAFNMTGENPDLYPYVLYYVSMILARRGFLDEAEEKLEEARAVDPTNDLESNAIKELALGYGKSGEYAKSADYHEKMTEIWPNDFSAWLALGTARHKAEQLGAARVAYLRAQELKPENPLPWHNLGMLASDQKQYKEARDCFQREVELSPDDAKAWYDYGVSLKALGEEEESANAFEQAEGLVKSLARRSSDLSAALSIVRRLNLGERVLKSE
jgi:tetratricopeptide (TPR) repeat protein